MFIFSSKADCNKYIGELRSQGKTVGFVPTMGALHKGHASLMELSVSENNITVVSIFVNPTQFNDKNDLINYPRTWEADVNLCESLGVQMIFAPEVNEMYQGNEKLDFDLGYLNTVMEGQHRPGHFDGVAQIVHKLFDVVRPNKAYFGLKDFQQLAVIKKLNRDFNFPIEIIECPIIREADGLAMSSRNVRLTESERLLAPSIYKILSESKRKMNLMNVTEAKNWVWSELSKISAFEPEYFEIVDGTELKPSESWSHKFGVYGCVALKLGKVRLIDNIKYA